MIEAFAGSTSHSIFFGLVDSTTGLPKNGIAFGAVTASYARTRSARVAITPVTLAAATTAYTSGGWFEVDGTNQTGLYRFDVPDAAFASGAEEVAVTVKATGCRTEHAKFILTSWNKQVASIPNAASGGAGGLATADASNAVKVQSGTGPNQLSLSSGGVLLQVGTSAGQAPANFGKLPIDATTGYASVDSKLIDGTAPAADPDPVDANVVSVNGTTFVGSNIPTTITALSTGAAVSVWDVPASAVSITGSMGVAVQALFGTDGVLIGTDSANTDIIAAALLATPANKLTTDASGFVTSATVTGSVGSVTGNVGGNVVGSVASVTGAVGSVTGAVGSVTGNVGGSVASVTNPVTVGTNNDKTGYALTQAFPANFSSLAITSSTGRVTVGTNADKTGYSLTQAFPANFSDLSVGAGTGYVTAGSVVGAVGSVTGNVGGNVVGSVASVTAGVTVTTVNDKSGYSLTQAFPANFAALAITSSTGYVTAGTVNDKTGYALTQAFPSNFATLAIAPTTGYVTAASVVGNVGGSVGSVVAPVTAGAVSDKVGYSLATPPPTAAQVVDVFEARAITFTPNASPLTTPPTFRDGMAAAWLMVNSHESRNFVTGTWTIQAPISGAWAGYSTRSVIADTDGNVTDITA